jgi:hypothetical protein
LYGALIVKRFGLTGIPLFVLSLVLAQSADAMPSHTDWERGRIKAASREAGARKREP